MPKCKIVNNGYFSENIELSRRVKQGCLLSTYLFMAIKMIVIQIRSNKNTNGLHISGIKYKSIYDTNKNLSSAGFAAKTK
jgi:hypothetical protein